MSGTVLLFALDFMCGAVVGVVLLIFLLGAADRREVQRLAGGKSNLTHDQEGPP